MPKKGGSSKRWLQRQRNDPYVRRAARDNAISRAHYKLEELDKRFSLIARHAQVLELGAAPGGWTRYIAERANAGRVIAIDPLPVSGGANVEIIEGCYGDSEVDQQLAQLLSDKTLDLVLSDMAPNISGVRAADQASAMYLADLAFEAATSYLRPGGHLVVKMFQGEGVDAWVADARQAFKKAVLAKPKSSRSESREVYAVALELLR